MPAIEAPLDDLDSSRIIVSSLTTLTSRIADNMN